MRDRFSDEIAKRRLIVLNTIATSDVSASSASFYVHKDNHLLSTFLEPDSSRIHEYASVSLMARPIGDIILEHGNPYYIKIDVEGYDGALLSALFSAGIRPDYISAEAHTIDVFARLVADGTYKSFKIVDGRNVQADYCSRDIIDHHSGALTTFKFSEHSSGPFGNDIYSEWLTADAMLLLLAEVGFGWKDIHASRIDFPCHSPSPRFDSSLASSSDHANSTFLNSDSPQYNVAVITPYFNEAINKLARCHESVLKQSYPCTHFLISDGPRHRATLPWSVRHIELGRSHADNGNTPRGLGAISAMNEGYDVIMLLDGDS